MKYYPCVIFALSSNKFSPFNLFGVPILTIHDDYGPTDIL